ncbi:MAG TPA: hypothetical protein VKD72_38495, partial [Gemmataceae bacterium]|nr:hypothetical protein [Gemmataceae bacterium]
MIVFDCTECGRTMQAAENAAGQQVRCPNCQAIIRVPETGRAALSDPVVKPELLPSPGVETGGEDEARRPCPMCGEMIIASAVKCRFCGEIF